MRSNMIDVRKVVDNLFFILDIHPVQMTFSPFFIQSDIHIVPDSPPVQGHQITFKSGITMFRDK